MRNELRHPHGEARAVDCSDGQEERNFNTAGFASASSHREKDDGYIGLIVNLNDKTRVVEGHDHTCWVIQTKFGYQWTGVSFHRDRDVLISRCSPLSEEASAILQSLEEWHP
jgi:hypothetical protein